MDDSLPKEYADENEETLFREINDKSAELLEFLLQEIKEFELIKLKAEEVKKRWSE